MKLTPDEAAIQNNFLPGVLTKDGFLGSDSRHVHDIIEEDQRTLARSGVTAEQIADKLDFFIQEGKKGLEGTVDLGAYTVQVSWQRGVLPSPFGGPGLYPKVLARLCKKSTSHCIRYSELNVHLIRAHCFFEGKGSSYRLEPAELIPFLELGSQDEREDDV